MNTVTLGQYEKTVGLLKQIPYERYQKLLESGNLFRLLKCEDPELIDKDLFRRALCSGRLAVVDKMIIPGRTEKFVARDHFVVDSSDEAKVKIFFLNEHFQEKFLGKVELPSAKSKLGTKLLCFNSKKSLKHSERINAVGGEDEVETKLYELFYLLEKQGNAEVGFLSGYGMPNNFYIRNIADELDFVFCCRYPDGWGISAASINDPGTTDSCLFTH